MFMALYLIIGVLVSAALVLITAIVAGKDRKAYYSDRLFWRDLAVCTLVWPLIVMYVLFAVVGALNIL